MLIGLTGSISSGKTFVSRILKSFGVAVFDSDVQVSKIYQHDKEFFNFISSFFPGAIIDGKVSKKEVSLLFKKDFKTFNVIAHFLQNIVLKRAISFYFLNRNKTKIVIFDAPLLFECNFQIYCDKTIVLYSRFKDRFIRNIHRGGVSSTSFLAMDKAQIDILEKIKMGDYIIKNQLSLKYLTRSCVEILSQIRSLKLSPSSHYNRQRLGSYKL